MPPTNATAPGTSSGTSTHLSSALQPGPLCFYQYPPPGAPRASVPLSKCGSGCGTCAPEAVGIDPNVDGQQGAPPALSRAGVRYGSGAISLTGSDLCSTSFSTVSGETRSYTNLFSPIGSLGSRWMNNQLPYLASGACQHSSQIACVTCGLNVRYFNSSDDGATWSGDYYLGVRERFSYNSTADEYTLIDTMGNTIKFAGFADSGGGTKAPFKSLTDAQGTTITVTSWQNATEPLQVVETATVGGVTTTEKYDYTYIASGINTGLLANITLSRQVGSGSLATIRSVDYEYYGFSESHGNPGDLKFATVRDPGSNALSVTYYRYYTGESGGSVGDVKYAFNAQSEARLAANVSSFTSASDSAVYVYADDYFEYDSDNRIVTAVVQGAGCSSCSGGQGTFTYSYSTSGFSSANPNVWIDKTVETLPDGNENIVYTNYYGEVMLSVYHDTTTDQKWDTYTEYDNGYRAVLVASPSAVSGYDESDADLVNHDWDLGTYQYLRQSDGLITTVDYYGGTTATSTTAGDAAGYREAVNIKHGYAGTALTQQSQQYFAHSVGDASVYPVATTTVYRDENANPQTTSHSLTWFSGSNQVQSDTVTLPTISSSQNGPGSADTMTVVYRSDGRPIWTKDGDGYLTYSAYDTATGGVTKHIVDVNTSNTSDFAGLPSGWSTPSGGGLHLISQYQVDYLGRTTSATDANGNVTYTVHDDPNHEVRVYPGWNSSTHTPTGPTQVYREDWGHGYTEQLTMTATPDLSSGLPTGLESISNVQTLARSYKNEAGQVVRSDAYFNLSGVTYSTSDYIGTQNTNYYTTAYGYDDNGRLDRTQMPTGTIYRTVRDGQGRTVSTWVGTNDTPSSGEWDPTNNTSPANMIQLTADVYDGGGVGDSNLTQVTQYPGGSATNRVTQYFYDWRDRQVATKSGVQTTEDTTTHRPILYTDMDNLGEVTGVSQYDGDGVTITSSGGIPNKPSSSLLRAYSTSAYDDQGRAYQAQTFSVNQSTGSVSTNALTTNTWYDHRGEVIKTSQPGGLVTKTAHDGAGRTTVVYTTDGGGDSSWSDAGNVTGDAVLTQTETQYDSDGNPILMITRDRFHDETATGALGNSTTSPKARVSYVGNYYDAVNRQTATVNVGTNGGSAYTRPSSVPSSSDTVLVTSMTYTAAGFADTVTDPRGLVNKTYEDALGRTTKTIQDYTDGTPRDSSDQTTEYTYDGDNHVLTLQVDLPSSAHQQTQYVYGVTTSGGNDINSNDVLAATEYPDPSTGNASTSQEETYTSNALGQRKTFTDRNGTVHTYSFDMLGRPTADAVTTLGSGVDGSVRRLETAYDTGGRPYLFTSFDSSSGGTIVNQVQDGYNGLGQLTVEYQSHSGPVNTSTTPNVQYSYSEMASGVNHSRLTSMTYPNGRVITYNYASGLDDSISRLSSISDGSTTLESYSYLGLSTVVKRAHPQPGVDVSYIKQSGESNGDAGDQYIGLDRFGRVVDQRWINTSTATATDRFQYGYDRDGNVLYKNNLVNSSFSELYHANGASNGYNGFNELTAFARGTLSDTNSDGVPDTISSASHSQSWSLDALGNWSSVTTDGTTQTRSANKQNEITSISGLTTPGYDNNGNTTTDQAGNTLAYDSWNRLVAYKNGSTLLASYSYDVLGRRVIENPGTTSDIFFSANWQVVEERVGGVAKTQYVWSQVYVNGLVERDRDADNNSSNGLEERLYVQQDVNWNVTTVLNTTGAAQERYVYDPYGTPTFLNSTWSSASSSAHAWQYLDQGGRYATTTQLYTFQSRDFSPSLGRWLQIDPLRFLAGDPNLYRFVSDDPTSLADPSGLQMNVQGGTAGYIPRPYTPPWMPPSVTGGFGGSGGSTPGLHGGYPSALPVYSPSPDGAKPTTYPVFCGCGPKSDPFWSNVESFFDWLFPGSHEVEPKAKPAYTNVITGVEPVLNGFEQQMQLAQTWSGGNTVGTLYYFWLNPDPPSGMNIFDLAGVASSLNPNTGRPGPAVLQPGPLSSRPTKPVRPLNWSIVSGSGETRPDHVDLHGIGNNCQKPLHGIFYGDPISVTNQAWAFAEEQGVRPIPFNGADIYIIPRPNSGWTGGFAGQGTNQNWVTIITRPGTNQIITAYPGLPPQGK